MAEIANFTQPDSSPAYFVEFLDSLDKHSDVHLIRGEAERMMNVGRGGKVLDAGCGIGGATFRIADKLTGPGGLAVGIDISPALVSVAQQRAAGRAGFEFRIADVCHIPYPDGFFDAARTERVLLYLRDRVAAVL